MGLSGKLIAAIEFEAGGDVFHELLAHRPHHVSIISLNKVQGCDLHEGEYGKVDSIISWRYTTCAYKAFQHDGKQKIAKQLIQSIDKEKQLTKFKTLGGDLMEYYKAFVVMTHIERKGEIGLVTWTIDYEMINEDVEHPISYLAVFIDLTEE